MQNSLVSVVVICYNYGKYLTEAVNSVLNQSYKNIEIIIINDGSTDNTDSISRSLTRKHKNIRYIKQKNRGIIITRNRALKEARGEYLIQLDADDYLDSDYVLKTVECAKKYDADVTYTDFKLFGRLNYVSDFPEFNLEILKNVNFLHSSSLLRLTSVGNVQYDVQLSNKSHEDWDFYLNLCAGGAKAVKCSGTLLNYRQHESGRNNNQESYKDRIDYIKLYEYLLEKHMQDKPEDYQYLSGFTFAKWYRELSETNEEFTRQNAQLVQRVQELGNQLAVFKKSNTYRVVAFLRHPLYYTRKICKKISSLRTG